MSFYVTLSSDKIGEFITVLSNPLNLETEYDVGLVEFYYTNCLKVNIGNIEVKGESSLQNSSIEIDDRCSPFDLVSIINRTFLNKNEKTLNTTFNVNYNELQIKAAKGYTFTMSPKILSFFLNKTQTNQLEFKNRVPDQLDVTQAFYIYCDLIEPQVFNQKREQLLQIIQPKGSVYKQQKYSFDEPHYYKVNKNFIQAIKISIQNEKGEDVNFFKGSIILKLHFKKHVLLRHDSVRQFNAKFSAKHTVLVHNRAKNASNPRKRIQRRAR